MLIDHPLAELLQFGVGGPLEAKLTDIHFRQAATAGGSREQGIGHRTLGPRSSNQSRNLPGGRLHR